MFTVQNNARHRENEINGPMDTRGNWTKSYHFYLSLNAKKAHNVTRLSILPYRTCVKTLSDKGMTLETSNYNENLEIFLKIAESDT